MREPGADDGDVFPFEPRLDRLVGPDRLHELLSESDIVVLAAPLTPETGRHDRRGRGCGDEA